MLTMSARIAFCFLSVENCRMVWPKLASFVQLGLISDPYINLNKISEIGALMTQEQKSIDYTTVKYVEKLCGRHKALTPDAVKVNTNDL